ncbi:MAG: ATP-binding protein [Alphaproteobacteria bacterium]
MSRNVDPSKLPAMERMPVLLRIAEALERLAPPPVPANDLGTADAFLWQAERGWLEPVLRVNRIDLDLLKGIDRQRDTLLDNTLRFAQGLPANNALLWGARGTGKSSLVKAVHGAVNARMPRALALVEIEREDIPTLPDLLRLLASSDRRCLLFCDDLSFSTEDSDYKSLKAVMEGGIRGRPGNVILYATSNRRHMMPREMIDNERATAIDPGEAVEEKVSLSDRFGLWLGFHNLDQPTFLAIVDGYAEAFGLEMAREVLHARALEWSVTRGARSGRVAWQFLQDLAGEMGVSLDRGSP